MLTLEDKINLINYSDYVFKSSPESSENSFTENMDITSDEDFMTQLSSDLDIPLLLNPGEDEMSMLSSFFDKSPDEILSDIASPPRKECTSHDTLDIKDLDFLNYDLGPPTNFSYNTKIEEHSDESSSSNSLEPSTPTVISQHKELSSRSHKSVSKIVPKKEVIDSEYVQFVPQNKVLIKRVPIQPKALDTMSVENTNNVLLINKYSPVMSCPSNINRSSLPSQLVVLDRIQTLPVNSINRITSSITPLKQTVTIPSIMVNNSNIGIDPKLFKRQQRKIKNRESACLSRKKKKDYLNLLEERVKELEDQNKRLMDENRSLKERLSFYEIQNSFSNITSKSAKPAIVLCVFLLVVGLNVDFLRNPLFTKTNKGDLTQNDFPKLPDHHGRSLLWTDDVNQNENIKNNTFNFSTMCPALINQTESARLLLELEKWIGKPVEKPITPVKRVNVKPKLRRKKIRIDSSVVPIKTRYGYGPEIERKNEIQVFSPKAEQLYSEFFEAINRQDDTFYVVSFSEQHMLLPALYHNKTRRPKMSLLMPSVLPNDTSSQTFVPLMQIDCEVLDTKLVNVKYGAIPREYRQYENVTKEDSFKNSHPDNTTSSRKHNIKKAYKPYFLSKKLLKMDKFN